MPENGAQYTSEGNEEIDNIELRSEEVQEILSHVPNAIIRWGITTILLTVVAIIIASWFIKYPDTIPSQIILTTETPPANITARSNGNINFIVEDGSIVTKGTHLGVLDNPANTADILKLEQYLRDFSPLLERSQKIPQRSSFDQNMTLGELQNGYIDFLNSIGDYQRFYELDFHNEQIKNLNQRIAHYQNLNNNLERQQVTINEELNLAADNYKTDSLLQAQESGTKLETNRSKSIYLQTKRQKQNVKSNITNNKLQTVTLQGQIKELRSNKNESEDKLRSAIENSFKQLQSQFNAWEQKFLLRSPIQGKVTFSQFWSDNQFINAGEIVMTVIPDSQEIFGQVLMPEAGSGKVEVGQKVNITFDNYPKDEYGIIIGRVEKISLIPRNNMYTVRVSFPNKLISTYKKNLVFKPEMQGTANIVTEDLRLIERIFNQFRSLFRHAG